MWSNDLARAACMLRGLCVVLALISSSIFKNLTSPYGRYLMVDCRFDPYFSYGSRDVAMVSSAVA